MPGARYGWPKYFLHSNGIPTSIMGLYQLVRPMVAIVDGIVGMEGDGCHSSVRQSRTASWPRALTRSPLIASCARLMGFDPQKVGYLWLAGWAGVGQVDRVETRGAAVEQLQR